MPTLASVAIVAALAQAVTSPAAPAARAKPAASLGPGHHELVAKLPRVGDVRYTLTVPVGYDPADPRPLVLALHPGGERPPYYGGAFVKGVLGPGVADLRPIIIAPDCPTPSWNDPSAERAVLELVGQVMKDYNVNRRRVLVAGFSMGGRGTWFFSARHTDLFTAAIVMAGSTRGEETDTLAMVPTYIIHSQADEVVPFQPAQQVARELKELGRPVVFEALRNLSHYDMRAYVPALRRAVTWVEGRWR